MSKLQIFCIVDIKYSNTKKTSHIQNNTKIKYHPYYDQRRSREEKNEKKQLLHRKCLCVILVESSELPIIISGHTHQKKESIQPNLLPFSVWIPNLD